MKIDLVPEAHCPPVRYDAPMTSAPRFAASHGITRAARAWLLWLALALAAAHSLAAWHAYTHSVAETPGRSADEKHAAGVACGLCVAVAGIGGAAPGHSLAALPSLDDAAPLPFSAAAVRHRAPHRPYAIRAPPVFHS